MADNFPRAVDHTLRHEGGYVDHPADPGGATNRGITLATYRAWTKRPNATKEELRGISEQTAREIYRENYWHPISADKLPHGVDHMVFDMGVNAGTFRSAQLLQEVLGVLVDGRIGPQTLAAAAQADPRQLIDDLRARHERYYRGLANFATFGRGWLARLESRHREAVALLDAGSATPIA